MRPPSLSLCMRKSAVVWKTIRDVKGRRSGASIKARRHGKIGLVSSGGHVVSVVSKGERKKQNVG